MSTARKWTSCKQCGKPKPAHDGAPRRGRRYVYCSDQCLLEGRRAYYRAYFREKFLGVRTLQREAR